MTQCHLFGFIHIVYSPSHSIPRFLLLPPPPSPHPYPVPSHPPSPLLHLRKKHTPKHRKIMLVFLFGRGREQDKGNKCTSTGKDLLFFLSLSRQFLDKLRTGLCTATVALVQAFGEETSWTSRHRAERQFAFVAFKNSPC